MKFALITLPLICAFASKTPANSAEQLLTTINSPALGQFTLLQVNDQLILSAGNNLRATLKTQCPTSARVTIAAPENIAIFPSANASEKIEALHLPINLKVSPQLTRILSVLLVRASAVAPWTVQGEWAIERSSDDKEASKDELQTVSAGACGLRRHVHRRNVESVEFTLPCGCCTALQTRTVETEEDEVFEWDGRTQALRRTTYSRWYVVQPGEGLLAVARKALGDPRRLARLYKLNPNLKPTLALAEGQKVLVDTQ
jgi:hypothetical protein